MGRVPSDSGIFGGTGELREYEEEAMGLMGQVVEERRQGACPPSPNRIGLGGRPPFPSHSPFPLSYSVWEVESY